MMRMLQNRTARQNARTVAAFVANCRKTGVPNCSSICSKLSQNGRKPPNRHFRDRNEKSAVFCQKSPATVCYATVPPPKGGGLTVALHNRRLAELKRRTVAVFVANCSRNCSTAVAGTAGLDRCP